MQTTSTTSETEFATAHVVFTVAGSRIEGDFTVPTAPTTLQSLLPALHDLTDAIVSVAEQNSIDSGKPVSCKKGCGACCRQLVPISLDEAAGLRELVDEMPLERREKVVARFSDAHSRLQAAGLLERLRTPEQFADDDLRSLGTEYFRLGIPCPFLEEESCSIHEDRPLACREYLVTSNPAHCSSPTAETIKMVPLPAKISNIITRIGVEPGARFTRWQPLILATDAPENRPAPELVPGPVLLKRVFERMSDKPLPTEYMADSIP